MVLTGFCLNTVLSSLILGSSPVSLGKLCMVGDFEHRLTSDTAHCQAISSVPSKTDTQIYLEEASGSSCRRIELSNVKFQ